MGPRRALGIDPCLLQKVRIYHRSQNSSKEESQPQVSTLFALLFLRQEDIPLKLFLLAGNGILVWPKDKTRTSTLVECSLIPNAADIFRTIIAVTHSLVRFCGNSTDIMRVTKTPTKRLGQACPSYEPPHQNFEFSSKTKEFFFSYGTNLRKCSQELHTTKSKTTHYLPLTKPTSR